MEAGLFSAVSSAFIIDVQSNLQPDPNQMTAAYMRILIHTMNESLFPNLPSNSSQAFYAAFDLLHQGMTRVIGDNRSHLISST